MKPRLHLLLIAAFAFFAWAAINSLQATTKRAFAQPPSGSSRSDGESRDRGRFGERGRSDWRSRGSRRDEERRGDEKRGDERSSSNGSSSPGSSSTNSSSRSPSSSTPTPSASTTTPASSSSTNLDMKKWATALVAKNDKNGDMILQPDEQKALGSSAAGEDLNHDGMITIDEIVMHHSAGATTASAPASAASSTTSTGSESEKSGERDREHFRGGGSGSDSQSKTNDAIAKRVLTGTAGGIGKDADKRHSYRFSKATDKLPTGLPPWFSSRDANRDGQVSMSEYSRSVSESMVAEFRRYDANDDGIITAKEAAKHK